MFIVRTQGLKCKPLFYASNFLGAPAEGVFYGESDGWALRVLA